MDYLFTWENWIYLGIILFILEIFTPGFVVACIGIGAFVASIFAYFDASNSVQLFAFSIATLISFFAIRPYALKILYKSKELKKFENINEPYPIEVKTDYRSRQPFPPGLKSFISLYQPSKGFIIHLGKADFLSFKKTKIYVIPAWAI